jgi:hypothetical protein
VWQHEHGEEKGPNGPSALVRNPSGVTSVQTLSAIKASARQHGQEAPLVLGTLSQNRDNAAGTSGTRRPALLRSCQVLVRLDLNGLLCGCVGRSLDDNERLPGEEGHLARKYSFNTITKNLT